jgi:hypothetical protein
LEEIEFIGKDGKKETIKDLDQAIEDSVDQLEEDKEKNANIKRSKRKTQ